MFNLDKDLCTMSLCYANHKHTYANIRYNGKWTARCECSYLLFFGEPIVCHYLPQMNVHFAAPLYNFSVCVRPSTLSTSIKPQKCYRQKPTLTTAIYICGKENLILSMHWIFFFFFKKTTTSNNHLKQQMNERCYYYCYHYCY